MKTLNTILAGWLLALAGASAHGPAPLAQLEAMRAKPATLPRRLARSSDRM